jgi:hypothetical protein
VDVGNHEAFGRLREYLFTPSKENWSGLIALLENWPKDSRQSALDYAKPHLDGWSDDLKQCPIMGVWELLAKPPDSPIFQFSSVLTFDNQKIGADGVCDGRRQHCYPCL